MRADAALGWLSRQHSDELVVLGLGTSTQEWHRIWGPDDDQSFHMHTMGLAASFGLGLAVACPQHTVWVIDGDGSLTLSFGSILTMAELSRPNLKYFLTSNRVYGTIDGPNLPNAAATDYAAVAKAAGVERAVNVSSLDELEAAKELIATPGFAFTVMEVEQKGPGGPKPLARYEGPEIKYRFARYLQNEHGIRVLGPLGY